MHRASCPDFSEASRSRCADQAQRPAGSAVLGEHGSLPGTGLLPTSTSTTRAHFMSCTVLMSCEVFGFVSLGPRRGRDHDGASAAALDSELPKSAFFASALRGDFYGRADTANSSLEGRHA